MKISPGTLLLCRHHDQDNLTPWVILEAVTNSQEQSPFWFDAKPVGSQRVYSFRGSECQVLGSVNQCEGKVLQVGMRRGQKPIICLPHHQPALLFKDELQDFDNIQLVTYQPAKALTFDPATAVYPKYWPERMKELRQLIRDLENSVDGYCLGAHQMYSAELRWRENRN